MQAMGGSGGAVGISMLFNVWPVLVGKFQAHSITLAVDELALV